VSTRRDPKLLAWPDLVWSHFSRPRFGGFDERVEAAAAAGFAGLGLYIHEFARLRTDEDRSVSSIAAQLDEHGLCLAEIEVLRGWWATTGDVADEFERDAALAFEMADGLGARYMQVIGPYSCGTEQAVDGLGRLCDRAARYGLLVGVEWLPYTNIASAADAQVLVEATGRANAGYCADIWHHVRGANDAAMLRRLPGNRIFAVQMNDGPLRPTLSDYKEDCLATRLPPGEGEFDCAGFLRILRELGVTAPISLEVASTELWERPAAEAAQRAADGMHHILAAAGG
jgi:sugar phosphate isomerase/epimerase